MIYNDTGLILHFQAIPDTKLTIKKYLDAKFEYLVSLLISLFICLFTPWNVCLKYDMIGNLSGEDIK